jgi:hypothetical protein
MMMATMPLASTEPARLAHPACAAARQIVAGEHDDDGNGDGVQRAEAITARASSSIGGPPVR